MTTQAAMSRQQCPPISSHRTPQPNSPALNYSPQHDARGCPLYAFPPVAQSIHYGQLYQMPQAPQYTQHPQVAHRQPMTSGPVFISHQQPQQQQQQSMQQTTQSMHSQLSMMCPKSSPHPSIQRPPSVIPPKGTPHAPSGSPMASPPTGSAGSGPNSSAAPGPIPATTPLIVHQDQNGVRWIAFEYSRDRVKMEYTVRCDVKSVNIDELSAEFKQANCVYPRACCQKDQYKGNRLHYESECNAVGWALAQLNPNIREKRGLIQRAVDSWRNSNQDPRLRSRRVRRQAKIRTKNAMLPSPASHTQGPPVLPPHGLPPGGSRPPVMGPGASNMYHHGAGIDASDHVNGLSHPT
ncbi:hypothetical protein Q7P37_000247 [Cladosporium fusiforme]